MTSSLHLLKVNAPVDKIEHDKRDGKYQPAKQLAIDFPHCNLVQAKAYELLSLGS
jgi:hypothetical protein